MVGFIYPYQIIARQQLEAEDDKLIHDVFVAYLRETFELYAHNLPFMPADFTNYAERVQLVDTYGQRD